MGWPRLDIEYSKKPIVLVLNPSNQLTAYVLKNHISKFFVIPEYGVFEIDANTACRMDKTPIFFYYSEYPKPIHLKYMAALQRWQKDNKIERITMKDIRQSAKLDRLVAKHGEQALVYLKDYEAKELDIIHEKIESVNSKLTAANEANIQKGKGPINVDPNDYAGYIIESLINDKIITHEEGTVLRSELYRGETTIDDFIYKLEQLKAVQIISPAPLHPRMWMGDFPTYKPADVFAYIKQTRGLDKAIEKLGQPKVKQLFPALYIVMIVLGVTIGAAVLVNANVIDQIRNFLGF